MTPGGRARRPAAWALARMGQAAEPATAALVKALDQDSGGAWNALYNGQVHAVDALTNIGPPAVGPLAEALASKSPAVRRGPRGAGTARSVGLTALGIVIDLRALWRDDSLLLERTGREWTR